LAGGSCAARPGGGRERWRCGLAPLEKLETQVRREALERLTEGRLDLLVAAADVGEVRQEVSLDPAWPPNSLLAEPETIPSRPEPSPWFGLAGRVHLPAAGG
jgi:hypothetical protein